MKRATVSLFQGHFFLFLSRTVSPSLNHRQLLEMFLSNLPRLGKAFFLTTIVAMVEAHPTVLPMEECCTEKMVGTVSYTLLEEHFQGQIPQQCINNCVYTVTGTSNPKFCEVPGSVTFNPILEDLRDCVVFTCY